MTSESRGAEPQEYLRHREESSMCPRSEAQGGRRSSWELGPHEALDDSARTLTSSSVWDEKVLDRDLTWSGTGVHRSAVYDAHTVGQMVGKWTGDSRGREGSHYSPATKGW